MADSWQLAILKALTAHLELITPAHDNVYAFDLSASVYRGRLQFGADDPVPLVAIVEHLAADVAVDVSGLQNVNSSQTWILLVQGWIQQTDIHPTDGAYSLKAAVELQLSRLIQADDKTGDPMYPDEFMLGFYKTCITGISIGPGVVSVATREESAGKAFFYLPVGIGLATTIYEPFAP
jgi:hypothetical protein